MRYFIDFEATQYTHEIISIGCVRENGEIFSSLVHVKRGHMTNFITQLTGITKDDVAKAPTSDEVFKSFYFWIANDPNPEFLCYGDTDIEFINSNLRRASDPLAAAALGILGTHLVDYAKVVQEYFGLHKVIALRKLVAYYRGLDSIQQAHDALEDSFYLKEVYDHISVETPDLNAFPEYKVDPNAPKVIAANSKKKKKSITVAAQMAADKEDIGLVRYSKSYYDEWACGSLYVATMRCIKRMQRKGKNIESIETMYMEVRKNIINAIATDTKYCQYFWRKDK